ncbi:pulmonary surfactant-associated protein A-like protein [Aphelenchoides avenae]|nr:pulmonary surfactant-associated protein A-like protein [Aphelenchus avenae]
MSTRHTFVCERGDGACQVMFLGLRRNSAGNFGWFDGAPFGTGSYVNWALGEPKSAGTEPCTGTNGCNNCVEMNLDGTWNNIQCDFNDAVFGHDWHSIMCEKPAHTSWIPGQYE